MTPFYTNLIVPGLLLFLLVASQIRLRFSLRLAYPLAAKLRQPFNKADWPFCLRLAKFLLKRLHLKQLHSQHPVYYTHLTLQTILIVYI